MRLGEFFAGKLSKGVTRIRCAARLDEAWRACSVEAKRRVLDVCPELGQLLQRNADEYQDEREAPTSEPVGIFLVEKMRTSTNRLHRMKELARVWDALPVASRESIGFGAVLVALLAANADDHRGEDGPIRG